MQAVKILGKNGIVATEAEAVKFLDFLYFIAGLAIDQYMTEGKEANAPVKI